MTQGSSEHRLRGKAGSAESRLRRVATLNPIQQGLKPSMARGPTLRAARLQR